MIEGTRNGSGGWLAIVGAISAALTWRLLAFSGPYAGQLSRHS